jgi:hypothetical protein
MVQVVSRRSLTSEAQVRSQVSALRFVVGKVAPGQVFVRGLSLVKIPPVLHTHLHLHLALTRRTNGLCVGTYKQKTVFLGNWGALGRKVLY